MIKRLKDSVRPTHSNCFDFHFDDLLNDCNSLTSDAHHKGIFMPETKFKVGDIVQLNSGGPKMTVVTISSTSGKFFCSWFGGAKHERADFPGDALKIAEEDKKKEK
jgi:uncharacterized protein YodC (DUF2158 family)